MTNLMVMEERGLDNSAKQRAAGTAMGVNFPAFEAWWKARAGLNDADTPSVANTKTTGPPANPHCYHHYSPTLSTKSAE